MGISDVAGAAQRSFRIGITHISDGMGDTGQLVSTRLRAAGHEAVPLRMRELDFQHGELLANGSPVGHLDALFVRGGASVDDHGLRVFSAVADTGVPVYNHPNAVVTARDKWATAQALQRASVAHPQTLPIQRGSAGPDAVAAVAALAAGPMVIKPTRGMGGVGVTFLTLSDASLGVDERVMSVNSIAKAIREEGGTALITAAGHPPLDAGRISDASAVRDLVDAVGPHTPISVTDAAAGRKITLAAPDAPRAAHEATVQGVAELLLSRESRTTLVAQRWELAGVGRDTRLYVVTRPDGELGIAGAIERRAAEGFAQANYSTGGSVHRAHPGTAQQQDAIEVAREMGLRYAGVDFIDGPRGPLVIEVNSSPGVMPEPDHPVTGPIWRQMSDMMVGAAERNARGVS